METEAGIQNVLLIAGASLVFSPTITIRGISQQRLEELGDYGSPFNMVKQNYSFIVSAYDIQNSSIALEQVFTLTVFHKKYTFKVSSFTPDLTGFILMYVDLVGSVDV